MRLAVLLVRWISACLLLNALTLASRASEPVCFRTAADAANQSGVRGVEGWRLESTSQDVYAGTVWATVRSCEHPERPAVFVLGAGPSNASARTYTASPRALLLQAGSRVQVVMDDGVSRLEMSGTALAGGAAGDRVRVRLTPLSADQTALQTAVGIVRSGGLVEIAR